MGTIIRDACPVCGAPGVVKKLEVKDFTVSHQLFEICECPACTLRFTQGAPDLLSIAAFYQSDAYISHSNTHTGIINKLYHFVRTTTLQRKLRLTEKTTGVQKGSLLDIGAGTGAFVHTAQLAGWHTAGLEPDAVTRQRAADIYGVSLQNTATL